MHLHLDCQFGMAGDMLLAALIDAGADQKEILDTLTAIPLNDFTLEAKRAVRGGVAAMLADVTDTSGTAGENSHAHNHEHRHDAAGEHHHDHHHHHDHDHDHAHSHEHEHHHGKSGPHRHLADLMALLDSDAIPPRVKERSARVFRIMASAEATVHGQTVDTIHFHEISGIDTAVDVIGACMALELLDIDSISASPPSVGSGMLMCEHGIFPVPAPATLEILKSHNIPWRAGGEGERATPTGMALLAGLAESYGNSPEITVTRIGYGAGHRDFADVPNLLRAIIGKRASSGKKSSNTIIAEAGPEPSGEVVKVPNEAYLPEEIARLLPGAKAPDGDRVVEFRFAVDDMAAEAIGYLCERCLATGALDAYAVPAVMKKSRPGHEVTVLAPPDLAAMVADVIWRESTTFGMRVGERSRLVLARDFRTVAVAGYKIRVKLGWRNGEMIRQQPEYEDCRAAALATGRTLAEVFAEAARDGGGDGVGTGLHFPERIE